MSCLRVPLVGQVFLLLSRLVLSLRDFVRRLHAVEPLLGDHVLLVEAFHSVELGLGVLELCLGLHRCQVRLDLLLLTWAFIGDRQLLLRGLQRRLGARYSGAGLGFLKVDRRVGPARSGGCRHNSGPRLSDLRGQVSRFQPHEDLTLSDPVPLASVDRRYIAHYLRRDPRFENRPDGPRSRNFVRQASRRDRHHAHIDRLDLLSGLWRLLLARHRRDHHYHDDYRQHAYDQRFALSIGCLDTHIPRLHMFRGSSPRRWTLRVRCRGFIRRG